MLNLNNFINFEEFNSFNLINENKLTKLVTSQKYFSPSQKYIFKNFLFECHSSKEQKIILDTFNHICKKKCQYIRSYNHLSFFFKSKLVPTFSMKYFTSQTLEQVLRTPKLLEKFKIEHFFQCFFAVAEGMSYLHSHLICHGNLCPSNIIIDEANQFYLCDFGLYPIKKLYIKEEDLFYNDYKDPYMRNNDPTFSNDIYSYGVLMCDVFIYYLKSIEKMNQDETLQDFLNNINENKFYPFPHFFSELISSCLNSFSGERPSFPQIIEKFKHQNQDIFGINIQNLYNDFINSNYLLNLAAQNDSNALNKIGRLYEQGKIFEKNLDKAIEFYEKAANLNNSEAQNNYGVLLQERKNKADLIKGAKYLRLSAEHGNIYGMANYAIALLEGDGTEKNFQKAEEYLRKSADLGYSHAQLNYGNLLLNNNPSTLTINEGLNYIKKSMNMNNPDAFFTFGELLQNGKFVEKNNDLAMEYFKMAADMGHEEAIVAFADANLKNKNEKVALQYYQTAFEKGNEQVQNIIFKLKGNLEKTNNSPKTQINIELSSTKPTQNQNQNSKSKENDNSPNTINKTSTKSKIIKKTKENQIKDQFEYYNDTNDDFKQKSPNSSFLYKKSRKSNGKKKKPIFSLSKTEYNNYQNQLKNHIPIEVSKKLNLISLGEIVFNNPNYHSNNYIYPVGYQVEREYTSIANQNELAKYKCSVLNGGEFPIFRVECLDSSKKVFEGNSPTKPWYEVKIRTRNIKAKSNQIIGVSGPIFYGFTYDIVTYLIERLPNANLCSNYSFKTYFPKIESNHLTEDENNNIGEEEEEEEPNEEEEKEQKCNNNSSFEKMQINDIIESTEDIDFKMPTEKLIEQGDLFYDKDDIENAFKCYKEALNRGRKDLLLKCAESCDNFQDKLEYLEQALKEKIPNSFNKWRTSIYKQYYLRKNRGNSSDLARRFEAFQNFSDAAILYDKNKDKINSQICYEKAKINIDNITDGYQQYYFGIFLIEKNDIELAKKMLQKAAMNKISQAETKLKMLSSQNSQKKLNEAESLLQEGIDYYYGTNGYQNNIYKALELFEKSSKLGCPKADYYIGISNINEYGAEHLKKSAESSDPDGQYRYAHYLKNGIFVIEDKQKAMNYFKLAADQGHAEASYEYGKEKYNNSLTKEEGIEYIKKSAELLFPDALYMYSKIIKDINAEDSKKFSEFAIEKGSKLALNEQNK